jgi:hypothetical protein
LEIRRRRDLLDLLGMGQMDSGPSFLESGDKGLALELSRAEVASPYTSSSCTAHNNDRK